MDIKILLFFILVFIIGYVLFQLNKKITQETFLNKLFSKRYIDEKKNKKKLSKNANTKEGFVSNQCPTTMIKKGNQIWLYNPKLAKIPGVNPIVLSSLQDYKEYVKWQRGSNISCPILHLERIYNTQGEEQYEIKQSFLLDEPSGPLNHELPVTQKAKRESVHEILNAHNDNNTPYNQNSFPSYDPYNQNIGSFTSMDVDGTNPNLHLS